MTVFGLGEQHPGEKGAQRHRQPDHFHQRRGADHDEQRRDREQLVDPGGDDVSEEGLDQEMAGHDHHGDGGGGEKELFRAGPDAALAGHRQQRHQRQQRDHRDVLEQQDRKGGATGAASQLAFFGQHLHDDRGRGQRQDQPGDDGRADPQADRDAASGQQRAAAEHLGAAHQKDRTAQAQKPRGLKFQSDQKQQQHHPELREVQDILDIAHEPQHVGPNQQSGGQIPQDRSEP